MPAKSPCFSIIMPTHNSGEFVQPAVDSVLRQTFSSWELLIVDDASVDNTVDIIRGFEKRDGRIRVDVNSANVGPAKTRNLAIAKSVGRYVAFLDSDDLWREEKLQRQFRLFDATGTPLAYSAYEKIDEAGSCDGRIVRVPEAISYDQLLGETVIATCTAAYDSARVGRMLMPDIAKRQDFGLWLSILRSGREARGVNEPLAYLRKRPGSVSSNKVSAAYHVWRVYRELERLSVAKSAFHFSRYAYHAFLKSKV